MVVARIFWYAYVHEGITSGLRGGKLILYVLIHRLPLRIGHWLTDTLILFGLCELVIMMTSASSKPPSPDFAQAVLVALR